VSVNSQAKAQIPVFYGIHLNAKVASFSPSAGKPAILAAELRATDLPLRWVEPRPVGTEDLERVHQAAYVKGILEGTLANGFGTRDLAVAASLLHTNAPCWTRPGRRGRTCPPRRS